MGRFRPRLLSPLMYSEVSEATFEWPAQSPGYLPALPRHAGYGMDSYGGSGRDGAEGRVVVFFQDDFTNGSAVDAAYGGYTRIRHGNAEGCAAYKAANPTTPVAMIPIGTGYVTKRDDIRFGSYFDYYGQFTPSAGIIWRETAISSIIDFSPSNASHQRFWHMDLRAGDTTGGVPTGDRDTMFAGGSQTDGSGGGQQILHINHFIGWSVDENIGAYNALGGASGAGLMTFLYCVIAEPLHKSIHDDTGTPDDGVGVDSHGYNAVFGQGYRWGKLCMQRCIMAHSALRNPEVAALNFAGTNNLLYNLADTSGNDGVGLILTVDYDAASPTSTGMLCNWTDNMYVKGPDSTSTLVPVSFPSGVEALPSGSQGYLAGNVVVGFTFTSQADLMVGSPPSGWQQGSLLTASWPAGWGSAREGTYRITTSSSPNGATLTEQIAFATLMRDSCGPSPGSRRGCDRAGVIGQQIVARLTGSGDQGAAVNSVGGSSSQAGWPNVSLRFAPNAGDWPTISSTTIDPFNPGSEWHAAMPLNGLAPDDRVLTSGSFSNGQSKIGYTALEAWAIEQHYYRGGK